jgi:cytoskeletal protein CcmA (bactofilin family)
MSTINESAFESRIGKGTKVSGKLSFKAPARIDGEADGEITGDDIVIAQGAVVTARITASRVSIAGTVSGEIIARERVELLPSARVRCSINTPSLTLAEGARFDGECKMPRDRMAA